MYADIFIGVALAFADAADGNINLKLCNLSLNIIRKYIGDIAVCTPKIQYGWVEVVVMAMGRKNVELSRIIRQNPGKCRAFFSRAFACMFVVIVDYDRYFLELKRETAVVEICYLHETLFRVGNANDMVFCHRNTYRLP